MIGGSVSRLIKEPAWQALFLWILFIVTAIIMNGTIPFALSADVRAWTYSPLKDSLFGLVIYAGLFMIFPLMLLKGRKTMLLPHFFLPLLLATIGIAARPIMGQKTILPTAALVVVALAYLHWRFDLSGVGIRSRGWKGDLTAIFLFGLMMFVYSYFASPFRSSFSIERALDASLNRLFLNPASTTENLFYFGFLTEWLSYKARKFTPLIVGLMYTAHEMSNPEYWYEGIPFFFVFIGVTLTASVYMWRRSIVVVWLGDGLGRFVGQLLT